MVSIFSNLLLIIDLGESNDIHPLNKKDLAHRCVLQMNKLSFGEKNIVAEGPMAEAAELKENGRIVISFRQGTGSLKQAKSLEGIAIAANDGKYKFVEGYTEGDKVIALWNGEGIPASIRYAWESLSARPTTNRWHATIRNGHASTKNMVHGIIQLTKK